MSAGGETVSEAGSSQAVKAQLRLREMVLAGELPGGTRIAEVAISEQLGVSRTPVRSALMRLEQEGLLEALPNGGYAVRTFSESDVSDAIELREGVAGIFREDELVLEAQQRAIDERPGHEFHNLNIDAGAMWARRLIDQLIAKEQPAATTIPIRPAATVEVGR